MKKSTYRRVIQAVAVVAMILVPAFMAAQQSLIPGHVGGPFVSADSSSELPPAPDASVMPAARQPILGSMFAIRAIEAPKQRPTMENHSFWDRENRTLFAVSAGWATADFFVTRANLAKGGRELNPVARVFAGSTPGLAANFALETGGVMTLSYIFHKTRHHRLERATSYVNISASVGAVAYGLAHR